MLFWWFLTTLLGAFNLADFWPSNRSLFSHFGAGRASRMRRLYSKQHLIHDDGRRTDIEGREMATPDALIEVPPPLLLLALTAGYLFARRAPGPLVPRSKNGN